MKYCNQCESNFGDDVEQCPDCGIPLNQRLPNEPTSAPMNFVEVLSTYNPADMSIIQAVLEGEQIDYYFAGDHFAHWEPMVDPARLIVKSDQAPRARKLLEELNLSFVAPNVGPPKSNLSNHPFAILFAVVVILFCLLGIVVFG